MVLLRFSADDRIVGDRNVGGTWRRKRRPESRQSGFSPRHFLGLAMASKEAIFESAYGRSTAYGPLRSAAPSQSSRS